MIKKVYYIIRKMVFPFLLIILFSCHENRITKRGNVSIADLDSMNIDILTFIKG